MSARTISRTRTRDEAERTVIGRFVEIRVLATGYEYRASVMDTVSGENLPKRVRIQSPGQLQGKVLVPGEYKVLKFWS